MTLILNPDTEAKLHRFAESYGCDPNLLYNDLLSEALEIRASDFEDTLAGIEAGLRDGAAGRERPFAEYVADVRAGRKEPPNAAAN